MNTSPPTVPTTPRRKKPLATVLLVVAILLVTVIAVIAGKALQLVRPRAGEHSAPGATSIASAFQAWQQIAANPTEGFPGKSQITILCMGIDDNWTDRDEVYTHNARTDTLFLINLDLVNKKASLLSIPRDSYVHIAGTEHSDKINAAYTTGGPARSEATVSEALGVTPDYYLLLNIDATKRMVDALGGVDLMVEHAMDYDDNWGHLHVHLKPGFQHLDGDEAVSFARFRHANHGLTPEDGDPRRIYRQHVLLRAMINKVKSFASIVQINSLADTAMSCIHTDLTRTQILDLAAIFHGVQQDDVTTAQLPGTDSTAPNGGSIVLLDDKQKELYTDWLMHGDAAAGRTLTPVVVLNATMVPGLASKAADALRATGYGNTTVGGNAPPTATLTSHVVDSGVANRTAAHEIASALGLTDGDISDMPVKPNRKGWTPPATIHVIVGTDYANTVAPAGAAATTSATTAPPATAPPAAPATTQ